MAYLVEQKVGDKIYVYEAVGYWDKEKKQARQKRVFLGRKDPKTGEIIPTRYSKSSSKISSKSARVQVEEAMPKSVEEHGPKHLAKEIMTQIGLEGCIKRVYGALGEDITALVRYMLLERGPYYLQSSWAECAGEKVISSQAISAVLNKLGENANLQDEFFREWNGLLGQQTCAYLDITSLSSYAQHLYFLEWGYNRDGEQLEQLNLGMLIGQNSGLPLMYRIYPGSIADVSTLQKTLQIGQEQYGLDASYLVMDRGFYSQSNLTEMDKSGYKFVIPVPASLKAARVLLSNTRQALQSPLEAFSHEGRAYFYHNDRLRVGDLDLVAHVYLNDERRAREVQTFLKRLDELESKLSEQTFYSIPAAQEYLESHMRFSSKLVELSFDSEGHVQSKRRRNVLSRWMNRFGKTIIVTNDPSLHKKEVLYNYHQKDCVEKYYDSLKNDLNQSRLRVHSQQTAEGHLFITFLTCIAHLELSKRMNQADLFKSTTIPQLISKLKTVRKIILPNGSQIITEIPKKLRTILQKLSVPLPN